MSHDRHDMDPDRWKNMQDDPETLDWNYVFLKQSWRQRRVLKKKHVPPTISNGQTDIEIEAIDTVPSMSEYAQDAVDWKKLLIDVEVIDADEESDQSSNVLVRIPPAGRLVPVLRFIFSERAFSSIFAQLIEDGREEYFQALLDGKTSLAHWRRIQIYLSAFVTTAAYLSSSIVKRVSEIWKLI